MSEKTSVLLSDVTIKGNVIEKEKLMTDAKIEGDVSAEVLQTFEGSNIKGNINSSNTSVGGALKGNIKSEKIRIKSRMTIYSIVSNKLFYNIIFNFITIYFKTFWHFYFAVI